LKTLWTIAELGREAGVGVETVRYYQRLGLLGVPAARTERTHRRYGADALAELRFVLRCKALGFSLKETGVLVRLKRAPRASCTRLHDELATLRDGLDTKKRAIESQLGEVEQMLDTCGGGRPIHECPALARLEMRRANESFASTTRRSGAPEKY
jgi:MerR family mercuric resistance operon transcriptional regulator